MMIIKDWKAYEQGKAASIEFDSNPELIENPYPVGSQEWRDWYRGWNSDTLDI